MNGVNVYILIAGGILMLAFFYWQLRGGAKRAKKTVTAAAKILQTAQPRGVRSLREKSAAAKLPVQSTVANSPAPTKPAIFPTMAITREGIKFIKLAEKIGNTNYLEPSLPKNGAHYMVLETNIPGMFEPYEPREAPVLSEETPQKAYRAIRWPILKDVFAYTKSPMEAINTILIGLIGVGMIVVMLSIIDKIGKP
jgi:hypothetical protein